MKLLLAIVGKGVESMLGAPGHATGADNDQCADKAGDEHGDGDECDEHKAYDLSLTMFSFLVVSVPIPR